ncbi:MAG: hypothetical protein Q4A66_10260 [Eubacteriales bacterium]|nr:hypothetical protein [Eubacteriales bacterium]
MSILRKLKSLFGGQEEQPAQPEAAPEIENEPEQPQTLSPEALEEARRREEALLEKLSTFHIAQKDTQNTSFLLMHSYRFERPFDGPDMRALVNGMRWLGFRIYNFSVEIGGASHACESWQEFSRCLSEEAVEAISMLTSFGGVRVNCNISAEGAVHFSHDSSRGVDFSPFEGLFDPEEIEPEGE